MPAQHEQAARLVGQFQLHPPPAARHPPRQFRPLDQGDLGDRRGLVAGQPAQIQRRRAVLGHPDVIQHVAEAQPHDLAQHLARVQLQVALARRHRLGDRRLHPRPPHHAVAVRPDRFRGITGPDRCLARVHVHQILGHEQPLAIIEFLADAWGHIVPPSVVAPRMAGWRQGKATDFQSGAGLGLVRSGQANHPNWRHADGRE